MPAATTFVLTLSPNYDTINVELGYTPDVGWPANTLSVAVEVQNGSTWVPCHEGVESPIGETKFRSKIFGLTEGVVYNVRCTFIRTQTSNGVILENIPTTGQATTRLTPIEGSGADIYISPSGNDTTGIGTHLNPYKTVVKAASVLAAGGSIIAKNGSYTPTDYDFTLDSQWLIDNVDGSVSAYKSVKAETPGRVFINGSRSITGLTWTKHATRVYRADFSAYMITAGTKQAPRFIRNVATGEVLYIYGGLDTDFDGDFIGINSGTMTMEGFTIRWSDNNIFLRLHPDAVDVAPTNGQYECSTISRSLRFRLSDAWIIDGINIEMFGGMYTSGSDFRALVNDSTSPVNCFRFSSCNDIVLRDVTIRCCTTRFDNTPCTRVTIENCDIEGNNILPRIQELGELTHAQINRVTHYSGTNAPVLVEAGEVGGNLVVRSSRIVGGDTAILLNGGSPTWSFNADITDCDIENITDDSIETDCTFANDGGGRNLAIYLNRFRNNFDAISLSPYSPGPLWFIANRLFNSGFSYWIKPGIAFVGDGSTNSKGHKLIYHNLIYSDYVSPGAGFNECFPFNGGCGNIRAINNIFGGAGQFYFYNTSDSHFQAINTYITNAFYSPNPHATPFKIRDSNYATDVLMQAAHPDKVAFTGNVYAIFPFPDGIDGVPDQSLPTPTNIPGITNFVADDNNVRVPTTYVGNHNISQFLLAATDYVTPNREVMPIEVGITIEIMLP